MTKYGLKRALEESERFQRTARDALSSDQVKGCHPHDALQGGSKTAACRRASMDLTRALTQLRKAYPYHVD